MRSLRNLLILFSSMHRKEKVFVLILTCVFVLSLTQYFALKESPPTPVNAEVFVEGMVGRIKVLNPLFTDFNDVDRDVSKLIFSGLIRFDPLEKNFYPDLAEGYEKSKNGLTYTLKIRPNVLWHDGTPFTVDDVVFTYRDVIQNDLFRNPVLKDTFRGITVERVDDTTVAFTLPRSNSYFISYLTTGVLPKHILQDTPVGSLEKSPFSKYPIGTGPYKVMRTNLEDENTYIDLASFGEYYGKKVSLQTMRVMTFPSEESLIAQRSALHGLAKLNQKSPRQSELVADPRFTTSLYTLNQFTALYLNTNSTLLSDKSFRQALNYSIDKNALLISGEQRIDSLDILSHAEASAYGFDLTKAKKLLDDNNYLSGSDGIRVNNKGVKVSLRLLALDKTSDELVTSIQNQLKQAGIEVLIEKADSQEFTTLVNDRRYDLLLIKQNLGYNRDVYPLFHSSQGAKEASEEEKTPLPAGLNFSNFKSFRTDGLTEALRKETSPPDKEKLLAELSKVLTEEVPVVFLSTPVYGYALDKRVTPFATTSLDFHSDRYSILPYLTF